jgi:hypothetical protein
MNFYLEPAPQGFLDLFFKWFLVENKSKNYCIVVLWNNFLAKFAGKKHKFDTKATFWGKLLRQK